MKVVKDEKLFRVTKTSKTMQIVLNIAVLIGWIGAIFAAVMMVVYGINGGESGVILNDIGFSVDETLQTGNGLTGGQYIAFWGVTLVHIVLTTLVMMRGSRILGNISKNGSVLVKKNTKNFRIIGILAIIASAVPAVETDIENALLHIGFRWDLIFIAIVIFCLSLVYDYGCDLQEQRDEQARAELSKLEDALKEKESEGKQDIEK